jgi:hypothetical protein
VAAPKLRAQLDRWVAAIPDLAAAADGRRVSKALGLDADAGTAADNAMFAHATEQPGARWPPCWPELGFGCAPTISTSRVPTDLRGLPKAHRVSR